ncbi:MAG: hypothetical protein QOJ99_1439 [Bryobacterales bacterium]|nr:hypothetical protein [Bryobacterales bacterium]
MGSLPVAQAVFPGSALAQAPGAGSPGGFGRGGPPPKPNSVFGGVQIGVISYSFRQGVPATDLVSILTRLGISSVEIMSNHAEALAGAPATPGFGGGRGRGQITPEQQAAAQAAQQAARAELDKFRAGVSMDAYKGVRKQFDDAGIDLRILCYNLNGNVKDEEIDYCFRMAQALGVRSISSSSTVTIARRVATFADQYKMLWGGHGHDAVNDPEQFATLESYAKIMSFSKNVGVNLDIGHFTAAGYDPISFIKEHHDRITNLHIKDRNKNPAGGGRGECAVGRGADGN